MAVIFNKLNQRLIIILEGGKKLDLLAKGTVNISEKELSSPHLQAFIAKGAILVSQANPIKKGDSEKLSKAETTKNVSKTEEIKKTVPSEEPEK